MIIKNYIPNHFLDLMEDKKYAIKYLSSKDPHEFTKEKLKELIKEYKTLKTKYKKTKLYLSIAEFFKNEELEIKILRKMNELGKSLQSCNNKIEVFESDLAAMLLLEIIDIERAKGLGHDCEYIKSLLEKTEAKTKRQYTGYYYDEKSGVSAQITESGKYIILPYTPVAVISKLNQTQRKSGRYAKRI